MYVNINKNIQSGNTDNNKQSHSVHILLSLLHACARASCAVVHFLSNSSGQTQKCGNCQNKVTFNRFSSTCGRAGRSFQPLGVHLFIIESPKMASLANFTASFPMVHSTLRLEYFCSTSDIGLRLALFISDEGSSPNLALLAEITRGVGISSAESLTGARGGC